MKHLTVEEIIQFVSMTELTTETIHFSAAVNGHIRKCAKCLELVKSFQMVHDELSHLQVRSMPPELGLEMESVSNEKVKKTEEKYRDSDTCEGSR